MDSANHSLTYLFLNIFVTVYFGIDIEVMAMEFLTNMFTQAFITLYDGHAMHLWFLDNLLMCIVIRFFG